MKNYVDLIKTCSNLLKFYLTNSINLNAEFPIVMRVYFYFNKRLFLFSICLFFETLGKDMQEIAEVIQLLGY